MIERSIIGMAHPPLQVVVETGQLRFFAKAIGETNPIYVDESAAGEAGHRALPVPPTFLFSLSLGRTDNGWREKAGIQLARILHGEQSFTYHQMAYAGDVLRFDARISDVYHKKNGALSFVVTDTKVSNGQGAHVADLRTVLVHRNG